MMICDFWLNSMSAHLLSFFLPSFFFFFLLHLSSDFVHRNLLPSFSDDYLVGLALLLLFFFSISFLSFLLSSFIFFSSFSHVFLSSPDPMFLPSSAFFTWIKNHEWRSKIRGMKFHGVIGLPNLNTEWIRSVYRREKRKRETEERKKKE